MRGRIAFVFLFLCSSIAMASGYKPCQKSALDIGALYRDADLVVIGKVVSNEAVDKKSGQWLMGLEVSHLFKGPKQAAPIKIEFFKPDCMNTSCGGNGIPAGVNFEYLFFLSKSGHHYQRMGLECSEIALGVVENGFVKVRTLKVSLPKFKSFLLSRPKPLSP